MPLFVVATPIGNLKDLSPRAMESIKKAEIILAEDTKVAAKLLTLCGISKAGDNKKFIRCDKYSEKKLTQETNFINRLISGTNIVMLSDAGSPTISDPGAPIVRLAHKEKVPIIPVPGPCAAIAALSVSGYNSSSFFFGGYFPNSSVARRSLITKNKNIPHSQVYYETPHRIKKCVKDLCQLWGKDSKVLFARELTKMHQTLFKGTLAELDSYLEDNEIKGEIVLVLEERRIKNQNELQDEDETILKLLLKHLPIGTAANLAAQIRKKSKKLFYTKALNYKDE